MARSARLTDIDPMPGRHLLTFELSEQGDELSIHGDAAGLRLLAERLSGLAAKAEAGTAAGAPTAPASPAPFTPSGLVVHGTWWKPQSNDGRSAARGIA